MSTEELIVQLSPLDEARFGIRTARAPSITRDTLPEVMDFCRDNAVALLIARCLAAEMEAAQAMERAGFALMDTLVYYERSLVAASIPQDIGNVPVRPIRPGEEHEVEKVATEAFRGYYGHCHADQRLDRAKCDEVYRDWALRSCLSRDVADQVLVAVLDGSIVGFGDLRLNTPEEGEAFLIGIVPAAQGHGIYRSFITRGMEWFRSRGATRIVESTQITNIAVQKVWTRVGFEPSHAYYTFHKWFDRR